MKKIFYLPVLALLTAACTKENPDLPKETESGSEDLVTFEVSVPNVKTKMTDFGNEDAISSLQVFVFNTLGKVDNYSSGTGNSLSVTCTKGQKRIYVLVNAPSLETVDTEYKLTHVFSDLLDNVKGNLIMTGKTNVEIDAKPDPVNVSVSRLPARICLKSFTNNIEIPQYKGQTFTVKSVFLLNVVAKRYYFDYDIIYDWYNFRICDQKSPLLYEEIGKVLAGKEVLESPHYFYCYTNDTSTDYTTDDRTSRYTRLVVETSIGADTFYYPVSIPNIQANTTYDVSIDVTRPGSLSPDIPVEKGDAKFTVSVTPWVPTDLIEETI